MGAYKVQQQCYIMKVEQVTRKIIQLVFLHFKPCTESNNSKMLGIKMQKHVTFFEASSKC